MTRRSQSRFARPGRRDAIPRKVNNCTRSAQQYGANESLARPTVPIIRWLARTEPRTRQTFVTLYKNVRMVHTERKKRNGERDSERERESESAHTHTHTQDRQTEREKDKETKRQRDMMTSTRQNTEGLDSRVHRGGRISK